MANAEELKELLETGLPGAEVKVDGQGDHFEAIIISDLFTGKTMVQQHRMIYDLLGDRMQGEIHAMALHTYTPESWSAQPRIQ